MNQHFDGQIVGLDIGGANLKVADLNASAVSVPFALWKQPEELARQLSQLLSRFSQITTLAVTMTGELCDCFADKDAGVAHIVEAVESAAALLPSKPQTCYWQTAGEFVDAQTAIDFPLLTAAANWHLLATWVGRSTPHGTALLLDTGSTTTDIIPIQDGLPNTRGQTDTTRLQSGELVYLGTRRTPLMALGPSIMHDGNLLRLANELFATTDDVFLLLGEISEQAAQYDTADGQPRTRSAAHTRIARMIGSDGRQLSVGSAVELAREFQRRFVGEITSAIDQVMQDRPVPESVILCGEGDFVLTKILKEHPRLRGVRGLHLNSVLNPAISVAACAYAAAQLASER